MSKYNKRLFSCLEAMTRKDLGAIEDIKYDEDNYRSITLSGEEDYDEFFYVNPKDDEISLGMVHDYKIGAIDGYHRKELYKEYLEDTLNDGCWIEDEWEVDKDMWIMDDRNSITSVINYSKRLISQEQTSYILLKHQLT